MLYNEPMKITVITPLFPPDIGAPAPYVKDLVGRLKEHKVTVWCYGHLPEAVSGVQTLTVSKRSRLLLRMMRMTYRVFRSARHNDVLYVQNGASVELPACLAAILTRTPLVYVISDPLASEHNKHSLFRNLTANITKKIAAAVIEQTELNPLPPGRPEILPLEDYPEADFSAYESAWEKHLNYLNATFIYVTS